MAVYRALVARGFRPAERGEFTFRRFRERQDRPRKIRSGARIIDAKTVTARSHAAGRLAGSLSGEISAIKDDFLATLRDRGRNRISGRRGNDGRRLRSRETRSIPRAARTARIGMVRGANYQEGAKIVLAGKTNAGKSSLFNALLKEDRAIVSEIEGTTRDWLESGVDFAGLPVDSMTPRDCRNGDVIEAEGVERSRALAGDADLVLYLVDGVAGLTPDDKTFLAPKRPVHQPWFYRPSFSYGTRRTIRMRLRFPKTVSRGATAARMEDRRSRERKNRRGDPRTSCARPQESFWAGQKGRSDENIRRDDAGIAPGTERQKEAVRTALRSRAMPFRQREKDSRWTQSRRTWKTPLSARGITGEVTSADILDTVFSGFAWANEELQIIRFATLPENFHTVEILH
jgi:tRNA modification GTPase